MTPIDNSSVNPSGPTQAQGAGRLFVISAPSGAGKSTLCKAVRQHFPEMLYSISRTTRSPRPGEKEGVDYFFISEEEFVRGIAGARWAEWAKVHDNYYGTCADDIDQGLAAGKDILLDIDVQGAEQIVRRFPGAVTIFIMPPTMEELRRRLSGRGTESQETIEKRMRNARTEMDQRERYQHILVNDELEEAISKLLSIISTAKKVSPNAAGGKQA